MAVLTYSGWCLVQCKIRGMPNIFITEDSFLPNIASVVVDNLITTKTVAMLNFWDQSGKVW
jgi:hypothetical protein